VVATVSAIRRIRLFLSLTLLALSMQIHVGPSSVNALELTLHGQEALAQIAECINRDDKDTLNVLYLVDDSGSLKWNDRDGIRTEALISSLRQFAEASENRPYFTINRSFTSFSNDFKVLKNWNKVTKSSFDSDVNWINSVVPNLVDGSRTNWERGLQGSLDEFEKVSKPTSCEILVWFTDGGLNVADQLTPNIESLKRICGFDPVNNNSAGTALIDKLRTSGIWIQGILLKNTDGQKSKLTDMELKIEQSLMSYFPILVEQSGVVDPFVFEPSSRNFKCGSNSGAYGLVQTVTDPVDIIWPTQQFNCMSTGGRVVEIQNGKFELDPGITRFSVTSLSNNFSLSAPNKQVIANAKGAVGADVNTAYLNSSNSVIQVSGKINQTSGSVLTSGTWSIKSPSNEKAVVCAFVDLDLQVSASTCYAGETCGFEGSFVRDGLAADLSSFTSRKLQAGELTESRNQLPVVELKGNSFEGKFVSDASQKTTNLAVLLTLKTKSGIEFNISTKKPIQVIPPGIYPSIKPNPIRSSDFLTVLKGKSGKATANLQLQGPSRTEGQICLGPVQVRSDSNPKRIEGFATNLGGIEVSSEKCFNLSAGEIKDLELSISNPIPANGTSKGFIVAKYLAPNQQEIDSKVDVQFISEIVYDSDKRLLIFAALMLLGIGLPLVALYLINAANSKILLKNLYIASIPVLTNASGGVVSLNRLETNSTSGVITQEDFIPFSAGIKKQKKVQLNSETLEGVAPKSPFGALRSKLTTQPGMVVISSSSESSKGYASNESPGSLNPAGLMYLVKSESALQQLKNQNQGIEGASNSNEARLVAFLSFDGDPYEQVSKLDSDIKYNAGWLNKLLDIELTAPKVSVVEEASRKKRKKIQEQTVTADNAVEKDADGWGESSASPTNKSSPVSDDWGSSSSQSKDDDW
jgi:hypothetical protein